MTSHMLIPNYDARKNLAKKLDLVYNENMQDWEYEVSDINRINEFIAVYDLHTTTNAEKEALMEIILDSINDLISIKKDFDISEYVSEAKRRLEAFPQLHEGTLHYWKVNNFAISEFLI